MEHAPAGHISARAFFMKNGIQKNVPLAPYTTLGVGGDAEYFTEVYSERDLLKAALWAKQEGIRITVLGGGSNVLIRDEGVTGLVIKNYIGGHVLNTLDGSDDIFLSVGAGVFFDELVKFTVEKGFWGLENLSGIPGSVGATPIQNVGAYGAEISDTVDSVQVFDVIEGKIKVLNNTECAFTYRSSIFRKEQTGNLIITKVLFRLSTNGTPNLTYKDLQEYFKNYTPTQIEVRNAVIEIRKNKFPDWNQTGTAGSFFKNPIISKAEYKKLAALYPTIPGFGVEGDNVKVPLGWILDKVLNIRGVQEGNVGTYKGQALVLINCGGATAEEITMFAKNIEKKVFEKTKIKIEREVTEIF